MATRLANSIARAVVQRVDDSTRMQLVQLGVLAGEDVDDAEHFQPYGFKSVPLAGAEAVVLFPNGDRAHPLVVVVDDRRNRPDTWQAGEAGLYNDAGAIVRLKANGDIEIGQAGGSFSALAKAGHTHDTSGLTAGGDPVLGSLGASTSNTSRLKAE